MAPQESQEMPVFVRIRTILAPVLQRFPQGTFFTVLLFSALVFMAAGGLEGAPSNNRASDPGVRGGPPGAGSPIAGLTANQLAFFNAGLTNFAEIDSVTGTVPDTGAGLGPRFNAEGCAQCHSQPSIGGTSPSTNPQVADATDQGGTNRLPAFITLNGPVREARFPYTLDLQHVDGGVHALFTITGRSDAPGCNIQQDNFAQAARENDLSLRIPTPLFGDGLIEEISDGAIMANLNSNLQQKHALGIAGRPNTSGNDGTITRFGWKAQNKSTQVFAGEAYNVEVGVTNEMFPSERDQTPSCQFNPTPEDSTNFDLDGTQLPSDVMRFTMFMRMLDQPQPGPGSPSTQHGKQLFTQIGCALCHTPSFTTGQSTMAALSNVQANLYSDLLLHHMGPGLADNISQGVAGGDEFRTAPLWGLGQRIFFLHDGRTSDLVQTIQAHASSGNHQYSA
ncbi:MAG TPA: di-heme oxidoredictase family protein, partial [Candidatus Bathyarchaeia archaeon]|nr:di-heme oxidoredictase family protein [Candidatus Bathyarchaeia archaeon]